MSSALSNWGSWASVAGLFIAIATLIVAARNGRAIERIRNRYVGRLTFPEVIEKLEREKKLLFDITKLEAALGSQKSIDTVARIRVLAEKLQDFNEVADLSERKVLAASLKTGRAPTNSDYMNLSLLIERLREIVSDQKESLDVK